MVSLLLKAGAAVNYELKDHPPATPLDMAFLFSRRTTVPILLRAGGVLKTATYINERPWQIVSSQKCKPRPA